MTAEDLNQYLLSSY